MRKTLLKQTILAISVLATLPLIGYSQTQKKEPCASTKVMQDLFKANPQIKAAFDLQEKSLQAIIKRQKAQRTNSGPVITIPVVVHVFHTGQATDAQDPNLSNEVPNPSIASLTTAIDLVAAEFNKRANKTRYSGGDSAGLKLCLAKKDENGVAYPNGAVTYHDGSLASTWTGAPNGTDTAARYVTYGVARNGNVTGRGIRAENLTSVVQWDPTMYYNIYMITQIDSSYAGAGTKGYAYFPGSGTYDYTVMDPSAFTPSGNWIITHEMGHAFNLRHTFAGAGGQEDYTGATCPNRESACDTDGDFCCDIPEHKSNFPEFCPTNQPDNTPNTCLQATGSPASPAGTFGEFQNDFMNYGGCHNTFSPDQVIRMRTTFSSDAQRISQTSLANVNYCGCGSTVIDLSVTQTVNTPTCYVSQTVTYTVVAKNNSASGATGVKVTDVLSGGLTFVSASSANYNSGTGIWNIGNLAANASTTLTISANPSTTGTPNICASIAGNETDNVSGNNSSCAAVVVSNSPNPPVANFSTTKNSYCSGSNIQFTDISSNGPTQWAWSFSPTTVTYTGGTNASSQNPIVNIAATGTYTVSLTATNSNGSNGTSKSITITALPTPSASISNSTICAGATTTLTCPNTSVTYAWSNGASTASTTVSPTATKSYSLTITDGNGCSASISNLTVTVNQPPAKPTITKTGNVLTSSASTGNQWFMNGTIISGAVSSSYTPSQTATYTVKVTDGNGCTNISNPFPFTKPNGIDALQNTTDGLKAYPNPFNQELIIAFELQQSENVTLEMIDYTGKIVATMLKDKHYDTGNHEMKINAGQYSLTQGVYVVRLTTSQGTRLIKVSFIQ